MTYKKEIKTNLGKTNPEKASSGKASPGKTSSEKANPEKANPRGEKIKLNLTKDIEFKHFFETNDAILKKMLEMFIPRVKIINSELVPESSKNKTFF